MDTEITERADNTEHRTALVRFSRLPKGADAR